MPTTSIMQHSFHAGEFAPALYARVDLAKYKSGVALARNVFVDYRGGLSSRMGTKYILQCYKSNLNVRLIPFQASFTVNYVLEFGDHYIRFYNQGQPVLENTINITNASGNTVTAVNTYSANDWVFITGVGGITNINGRYFIVSSATGANFTVTDLFGNAVTFTGVYTAGGTSARVYTLATPYDEISLRLIKYAQNVNTLVLCHPDQQPQLLTLVTANNWTLTTISFGSTILAPTAPTVTTTLAAGTFNYSYIVTAVDANGQESGASPAGALANVQDLRTVAKSNTITWTAVASATSYNVYKAEIREGAAVPAGAAYGFIGNCTGVVFIDSNIPSDFTQGIPIAKNPFLGAGVQSVTITNPDVIAASTAIPTATFAAPASGTTAAGQVQAGVTSISAITIGGSLAQVGDILTFKNTTTAVYMFTGLVLTVVAGGVTSLQILTSAAFTGTTPTAAATASSKHGGANTQVNVTFGVSGIILTNAGSGYTSAPAITFSSTAAAATAVLATQGSNPTVPSYMQQRLVLAGLVTNPQEFDFSQPGLYFNFDVTNPIEADDAIQGTLSSTQLNNIKALIPMSLGLVVLTDKASWLINGGAQGAPVTPTTITANEHSYNGANDVPPIVSNFDILYVQSKGSIVRDLTFNYYAQIYTGTDISVLSSHLFYGFQVVEWSYAEEPFKLVWGVRNDGKLLALTFLKEQDIIGWTLCDFTFGLFKSTTTVVESTPSGNVDAPYFVVERLINGKTVKYIERMAERSFNGQVRNAWCVDAGLQYSGAPATVISGLWHLIGVNVVGLADGQPFSTTVASDGTITLSTPASLVTVGYPFTGQVQTLRLDTGEPNIQGKRKAIGGINLRVQDTLGLSIGKDFGANQVPMKDLIRGNLGTQSNEVVVDLVTGDVRTIIDPSWDVEGQYCIQQSNPYPFTLLGAMPEIEIGDSK